MTMPAELHAELAGIVGAKDALTDPADMASYVTDRRQMFDGSAEMVVRPNSVEQVARIVMACASAKVPIVPQGGNTGFVGGSIANEGVLMNLGRLNKIREMDPANFTMTVESGCVLADLQSAAADVDRLFPLSLGAQGSCQIGGNLSTNAGGVGVLRYGNARDLALGLEVVLPSGEVWNGLRTLRKDNTGYDLKHLFIGGEGTLGVITAATLKLFPMPKAWHTAYLGFEDIDSALDIFSHMRHAMGDTLTAFELMHRTGLEFCFEHIAGAKDPLEGTHPYHLLIEVSEHTDDNAMSDPFQAALMDVLERGWAQDVAIAQSEEQRQTLWLLRHTMPESMSKAGGVIGSDVSVPVSQVPTLIKNGIDEVQKACPGIRPAPFGHLGDGNIHFTLVQPVGADRDEFLGRWDELSGIISDVVKGLGGSFSAEHGIGSLKRDTLVKWKSEVEIDLMRSVKSAIDPDNLMNPGKIWRNPPRCR
jgi:FAD/FMN-containing dehydrogenase